MESMEADRTSAIVCFVTDSGQRGGCVFEKAPALISYQVSFCGVTWGVHKRALRTVSHSMRADAVAQQLAGLSGGLEMSCMFAFI